MRLNEYRKIGCGTKERGIIIFKFVLNLCTQVTYFTIHDIYLQSFISFCTSMGHLKSLIPHFLIISKGFSFLNFQFKILSSEQKLYKKENANIMTVAFNVFNVGLWTS